MEIKRWVILAFALLFFCSFFASASNNPRDIYNNLSGNNTVKVFVTLNPNLNAKLISLAKENIQSNFSNKGNFKIRHDFGKVISMEVNQTQLDSLMNNAFVSNISLVEEKHIFLTQSVPLVNATSLWQRQINGVNLTGKGETVCIPDTGVNFMHPDLIGKNLTCVIDCISGVCAENCSIGDWHGHGTHIAGIIGANGFLQGVAPEVSLIGLRVCDSTGTCADDDLIAAMDWCTNNFDKYNISVISLSLGGGQYNHYCDAESPEINIAGAVNRAFAKNISVVVASGNIDSYFTNPYSGIASPACVKNATRVSAINKDETFASYAFRNQNFPDLIFAPGTGIYSTYNNGGYATMSGTSMATPHVSGAIAIINQYKKLEKAIKLKPNEIVLGLNNSGKRKYDSGTGANFSLLDVYSAVLYLDNSKPVVSFISPSNNTIVNSGNISFYFNITDLQLRNVSIYLWNSSSLINKTDFVVNANQMSIQTNFSLSSGYYFWNVLSSDYKNNSGFNDYNISFSVSKISTRLISPINQQYTNMNALSFTCDSSTSENNHLVNVSFYLWNSSGYLISNISQNISGTENSTSFNYSNLVDGNYSWTCVSYDNYNNYSYGSSNYSFVLDVTNPIISLVSPANSNSYTDAQTISFSYNVNELNIANCSLILNGASVLTSSSIDKSNTNSFSSSLSVGSYTWKIRCYDLASNFADSESRSFEIKASSSSSGSGSGGGGGGGGSSSSSAVVTPANYSASDFEIISGITKQFQDGQSIKFFVNGSEHILVTKSIYPDKVLVDIFSNPIELLIYLNQSQKIDIDNDGYYDLQLNYLGLSIDKANIYLKSIREQIQIRHIFNESTSNVASSNNSMTNSTTAIGGFKKSESFQDKYSYQIFLGLWILWILFLFFIIIKVIQMGVNLYLDKKKANSVNQISSHFKNQLVPHYLNNGVPPNFKRYYPNDYGKNKGL